MVDIQSKEAIDQMSEDLKIQPAMALPRTLVNTIQPVYSINTRRLPFSVGLNRSTSGNLTVFTTPTDKDFYLSTISIALDKDATADPGTGALTVTSTNADGSSALFFGVPILDLTAQSFAQTISFPIPIKLARGVAIVMNGTFIAGVMNRFVGITGYTVDPQ